MSASLAHGGADVLGRLHREAVARHAAGETVYADHILRSILALDPGHGPALNSLCGNLLRDGQPEAALTLIDVAFAKGAAGVMPHRIHADLLRRFMRYDEAIAAADRAVTADPDDPMSLMFRSSVHYDRLDFAAAGADAVRAAALRPDFAEAHLRVAELALLRGDFRAGWPEYVWNERIRSAPPLIPPLYQRPDQRRWQGETLADRTLLLIADQGYGDAIQFSRYIGWAGERSARLSIACSRPLRPLMRQAAPGALIFTRWDDMPPFAAWAPLSSLPGLAGTTLDTIPPAIRLAGDTAAAADWQSRLASLGGQRRIGIAWAGRPSHGNDINRSTSLARLAPLLALERTLLVSLQQGTGRDEIARHATGRVIDAGPLLDDFGATAALIEALDLVITVDSAVAHLAGAMGKPVWLAVPYAPEWRWMLDRADTPWYPGMRLFRAPAPRAWEAVAARMAEELR